MSLAKMVYVLAVSSVTFAAFLSAVASCGKTLYLLYFTENAR